MKSKVAHVFVYATQISKPKYGTYNTMKKLKRHKSVNVHVGRTPGPGEKLSLKKRRVQFSVLLKHYKIQEVDNGAFFFIYKSV